MDQSGSGFETIGYRPEFGLAVVKMWRQSFQRAMSLPEQNQADEVIHQLEYLRTIAESNMHIVLDRSSSSIAGFMVLAPGELEHLYVSIDYQGTGIGSGLLRAAQQESGDGLELYTFQKNARAQEFYERHGFVEVARGYAALENNPWASSTAQLADIRYRWAP